MSPIERFITLSLLLAVMASSFAVIYNKYNSRKLFTAIQELSKELDHYEVEWGQLELERNTRATHAYVEYVAMNQLGMVVPDREEIVYLRP
jgi:cell division protein FtsL